jgi:hypothetical protein
LRNHPLRILAELKPTGHALQMSTAAINTASEIKRKFGVTDGGRRTMRVPARVYISAPQAECISCDDDMTVLDIKPTSTAEVHIAFYECPYCKATSDRTFFVQSPAPTTKLP